MNQLSRLALLLAPLIIVACSKKEVTVPASTVVVPVATPGAAPAPAAAPAAAVDPESMTEEQRNLDHKQKALDFATMEDKYLNDPLGQWATSATGSSSATDGAGKPYEHMLPSQLAGAPDGNAWQNKSSDMGFEWVQLEYAKPVNATEVRLVVEGNAGVEALNKVELQDTNGKWNTVWTGISDVKQDKRGARTWFVKSFPKTAYKVKAVKYTVANNVSTGDKIFDAGQLVGE